MTSESHSVLPGMDNVGVRAWAFAGRACKLPAKVPGQGQAAIVIVARHHWCPLALGPCCPSCFLSYCWLGASLSTPGLGCSGS